MRAIDQGVAWQSVHRFRRVLLLQILPGALAASWVGMARAVEPLGKIPEPGEIFAFGNAPAGGAPEPGTTTPSSRALTVEDLCRFLRDGARKPREEAEAPEGNAAGWPKGVFFTRGGSAYFWSLRSRQTLRVAMAGAQEAFLRLPEGVGPTAQRRDLRRLQPPAAKDLLWFTNGEPVEMGLRVERTKEDIARFLEQGTAIYYATPADRMLARASARLTLSDDLARRIAAFGGEFHDAGTVSPFERDLRLDGALATRDGKVFFWEQWGDSLLCLSDSSGTECGLEIFPAGGEEAPGPKSVTPGR